MNARFASLTLALLATAACKGPDEINYNCTDEARAGIVITVLDSASGVAAGKDARIVAKAGTFTDSVPGMWTAASDGPFALAHEHAGTYTLTVSKTGYRDWTKTGIVVTKDECHVRTVSVTARLQQ
jgi:hypothetical protein